MDETSTRPPSESAVRTVVGDDTLPPDESSDHTLEAGKLVDRYVVLATLGQGGMGVVYAAHDPMLDRKVALKLLRPGASRSPERARARLLREAQAMARISSPHVVAVHDVGVFDHDVYFTMEYVDGVTLRMHAARDPLGWRAIVALGIQAAHGLLAVHRAGLLHRDVKPDNIMVGHDGRVRLMDLGIAQLSMDIEPSTSASGLVVDDANTRARGGGTPAYMAPELLHDPPSIASDEFALCVTLYEILYGALPFAGVNDLERVAAVLSGAVRPPVKSRRVPRAVREVLIRGLAPKPEQRWPGIDALIVALERTTRARGRQIAFGALGLFGVGALGLALRPPAPEVCTGANDALAAVWNPTRADEVGAHLEREHGDASVAWVTETWAHVRGRLDEVASQWIATHTEVCRATQIHGERSTLALDRSMACLARQRARIDALVDALANDEDASRLARAAESVARLAAPSDCEDLALLGDLEIATTPASDAAREQIARADQIAALGDEVEGLEVLVAVEATARELDDTMLLAEALTVRGLALSDMQRTDEAQAVLIDGYLAAQRASARLIATDAAAGLMFVTSHQQAKQADADLWSRIAEATLPDSMRTSPRAAALADAQGVLAIDRGEFEQAKLTIERAIAMLEQVEGDHEASLCSMHDHLGTVTFELGDLDAALIEFDRAHEYCGRSYGPGHPRAATPLVNRARIEGARGDIDAARQHIEAGVAIYLAALGPNDARLAMTRHNLGTLHMMQGNPAAARPEFEAALAGLRAVRGAEHPDVALPLAALGNVALEEHRSADALALFDDAIRITTAALGAEHPALLDPLVGRGTALRELGDPAAALEAHEHALRIAEATDGHPGLIEALFGIAGDRIAQRQPARARVALERARAHAVEIDHDSAVTDIDKRLSELGEPTPPE